MVPYVFACSQTFRLQKSSDISFHPALQLKEKNKKKSNQIIFSNFVAVKSDKGFFKNSENSSKLSIFISSTYYLDAQISSDKNMINNEYVCITMIWDFAR